MARPKLHARRPPTSFAAIPWAGCSRSCCSSRSPRWRAIGAGQHAQAPAPALPPVASVPAPSRADPAPPPAPTAAERLAERTAGGRVAGCRSRGEPVDQLSHRRRARRAIGGDGVFRADRGVRTARASAGGASSAAGLGSGVLIDGNGHIVTNNHVVEDATELAVGLPDGTLAPARCSASIPTRTSRCCSVDVPGLTPITLGDIRTLAVGDVVLAVGNPLGRRPDGHAGHRQRGRPQGHRHQHDRELHPDRCRDQPGQFGRRADRHRRTADRASTPRSSRAAAAPRASASRFRWTSRSA